jgi:two-component system chemotaxis response regulator CheY
MSIPYAKLRVLVVEDHKFTRQLIKEILQNLGCQQGNIIEVEDGEAGLMAQQDTPADLIICDWQMKPMDGLTLVQKLRDPDNSNNPFVPVILCSAHTDRELIQQAVDDGVNEIMAKPISISALESRIRMIFEQPRPFVRAKKYFGPDRRRRSEIVSPTRDRRRARRTVVKQVSEDATLKSLDSPDGVGDFGDC